MRHPFWLDRLDPEDQGVITRWYVRVAVFYCSLTLIVVAIVALRVKVLDPQIDNMQRELSARIVQPNGLVGAPSALATSPARAPGR